MISILLPRRLRLLLSLCLLLPLAASAAPLALSQLYEPPSLGIPRVSPDGKRVALRAEIDGVQYLAMMDTTTQQLDLVGKFETTALYNIFWKSDTQLLLIVGNREGTASEFRAFDLQTKKVAYLADNFTFSEALLLSSLVGKPDEVVVQVESVNGVYLARLNIRTGKVNVLEKPSSSIGNWIVDQDGNPIAAVAYENKKRYLQWRPSAAAPWTRSELGPSDQPGLRPFAVHPDKKRLLAWEFAGPGPVSLVALDPATLAREVLFQHAYADLNVSASRYWATDPSDLFAVNYEDDRPRFHFLSNEAAQIHAALAKALPDTFNDIVSTSADHTVMAIVARSDRNPGTNYLFSRRTGRLTAIGPTYPNVNPAEMGASRPFAFKAKDGLTIHGRLLLPPGNPAKPPVLLMIGPYLNGPRSAFDFVARQQVLATRGYAVVQVDARGTDGYGHDFAKAGDFQLAGGIVDDVLAGMEYVVDQGWVDPERVGLYTTGFGGYVGMQALARSNRFKVWVNDGSYVLGYYLLAKYLAFSFYKEDDIMDAIGGRSGVKAQQQLLDGKTVLPRITTTSFHLYKQSGSRSLGESADLMEEYLKVPPERREIVGFDPPPNEKPAHAAEFKAREKMFVFLARWLGPAPAKP